MCRKGCLLCSLQAGQPSPVCASVITLRTREGYPSTPRGVATLDMQCGTAVDGPSGEMGGAAAVVEPRSRRVPAAGPRPLRCSVAA